MQFLFASGQGQVSVFGDICQQRIGASLHYCYLLLLSLHYLFTFLHTPVHC